MKNNNKLKIIIFILVVALIVFVVVTYPYKYNEISQYKHATFSLKHLLGTDYLGRDFLARTFLATFNTLVISIVSIICSIFIGSMYGMIAGYAKESVSKVMYFILNIIESIPEFLLAMLLLVVFNNSYENLGLLGILITLIIVSWTNIARIVMNETKALKESEFVQYAKRNGASTAFIIKNHLLPNLSNIIIVTSLQKIPSCIFLESFLSFIGIGIQPPFPSLGRMISEGLKFFRLYPRELLIPCFILIIIVVFFNILLRKNKKISMRYQNEKRNIKN